MENKRMRINQLIILIVFVLFTTLTYSQDKIPKKKDLKNFKVDTLVNISDIFENYKNWEEIAWLNYKTNKYTSTENKPKKISIINSTTINYVTGSDLLNIIDKHHFEITYGGSGPEKQTFRVIALSREYLILESNFTDVGKVNGKIVWKRKNKFRYIWKLKK